MKERPIIFSGAMVRAILDGRKTQTRRVVKNVDNGNNLRFGNRRVHVLDVPKVKGSPYGKPGDRLWVRETCSYQHGCGSSDFGLVWYWADGNPDHGDWTKPKPSIHMPRWASRITLEITDVRVELLQEIRGDDAVAEGIDVADWEWSDDVRIAHFAELWDSINGEKHPWDSNPWVWVVEFKRIAQDSGEGDDSLR